jgi:hypothetical protein
MNVVEHKLLVPVSPDKQVAVAGIGRYNGQAEGIPYHVDLLVGRDVDGNGSIVVDTMPSGPSQVKGQKAKAKSQSGRSDPSP